MKKIAIILAVVMIISAALTGCGNAGSSTETPPVVSEPEAGANTPAPPVEAPAAPDPEPEITGGTLRVILSAEPGSINPLMVTSAGDCNYVAQCMFDTLVFYNSATKELEPSVATGWEWMDDTHLKMTLRDDVVAPDGSTYTANDVLFTMQCGVNGDAKNNWQYVDLDECSVEDDQTIIIGLTEIHPTFISLMSNIVYFPLVDESSVEANGGWDACGRSPLCTTGPYRFDEWADGEFIRLVRNEDYWGTPGNYDEIIYTWVEDSTSRTMAIAAGDGDFAVDIDGADYNAVDSYDNCQGYVVPGSGTFVLFMNTNNEYLSNEKVREAVCLAIDAEAMRQVGAAGLGDLADSVLPSSNAYYFGAEGGYSHDTDIEKAKELLAEAGYPDGFELNFPIPSFNQMDGEVIQACLSQIGITVKLDTMEFFNYLGVSDTGEYDLAYQSTTPADVTHVLGQFDNRLPLNMRFGGIVGGFDDLNEILDVCRYSTDEEALMQGWKDFQDYIRDHYLFVPCYTRSFFYAATGDYTMACNPDGVINFARVYPVK